MARFGLKVVTRTTFIFLTVVNLTWVSSTNEHLKKALSILVCKILDGGHPKILFTLRRDDFAVVSTGKSDGFYGYSLSKYAFEKHFEVNGPIIYEEYAYYICYNEQDQTKPREDLRFSPKITSMFTYGLTAESLEYATQRTTIRIFVDRWVGVQYHLVNIKLGLDAFPFLFLPIDKLTEKNVEISRVPELAYWSGKSLKMHTDQNAPLQNQVEGVREVKALDGKIFVVLKQQAEVPAEPAQSVTPPTELPVTDLQKTESPQAENLQADPPKADLQEAEPPLA